jgi:two-component system, LytTR family, response regulator
VRVLLVDDEASARRRLARMLSAYDDVEIVGEAKDGLEALNLVEAYQPDVLFLDVQMPELDGFGVVRGLSSSSAPPLVIFATSFDHHALAAFEANAVAYLLKPIESARLETAIVRARRLLNSALERAEDKQRMEAIAGGTRRLQRVVCRKGHTFVLLDPEDIFLFYMDGGIVRARTAHETYWVNYQLAEIEEGLASHSFFRARREVLINLNKVKFIKPCDRSTFMLTLADADETELLVSERQAKELRQRLPGL